MRPADSSSEISRSNWSSTSTPARPSYPRSNSDFRSSTSTPVPPGLSLSAIGCPAWQCPVAWQSPDNAQGTPTRPLIAAVLWTQRSDKEGMKPEPAISESLRSNGAGPLLCLRSGEQIDPTHPVPSLSATAQGPPTLRQGHRPQGLERTWRKEAGGGGGGVLDARLGHNQVDTVVPDSCPIWRCCRLLLFP